MKNYYVTITHPAVADLLVEASSKDEAIDKARIMLTYDAGVEFKVNIDNPAMVSICASEESSNRAAAAQERSCSDLKAFVVALDAISHKEVPLHAASAEAAIAQACEMYFQTDALDFCDGDVERVTATIVESEAHEKEATDPKLRYLTDLVREIRNNPEPDELVAGIIKRGLDEIFAARE